MVASPSTWRPCGLPLPSRWLKYHDGDVVEPCCVTIVVAALVLAAAISATPAMASEIRLGRENPETASASQADTQWTANGRLVCGASGYQSLPSTASDGQDGAFVAWADLRSGSRTFLQRILADGSIAPGWPVDGIAMSTSAQYVQGPIAIADATGGVYVVWVQGSFHVYALIVQHIDQSGGVAPGWPAEGLHVGALGANQYLPCAASDDSGGVYIAWSDERSGTDNPDLYVQRIMADASVAPGWTSTGNPICVAAGYQYGLSLASDGLGGGSGDLDRWLSSRRRAGDTTRNDCARLAGEWHHCALRYDLRIGS